MYRKTFLVYPTTLKQHTSVENFITDSGFTPLRESITVGLTAIGLSDTDTSRFVLALSEDNYYMKFTIKFDSEEQSQTWNTEYNSALDSKNVGDVPFFEEWSEADGNHLI